MVTQKPEENVNVFSKWLVSGGIWEWLGIYLMGVNAPSGDWEGVSQEHHQEQRILFRVFPLNAIPSRPIPTIRPVETSGTKTIPAATGSNPAGNNVRLLREPVE